MINCFNNKLLNTFTLYFDIHNRNWRMCMEYINMLMVMTGKHALLYHTIWIYCFHFHRKIYKYLTFYKKKNCTSIFFVLKKKFKIVKIPLKHDICGLLFEWYWREYLSNHFWYRFCFGNMSETRKKNLNSQSKDIVYNVSKYFEQQASVPSTGADSGGGTHPARTRPKIGKNMIFLA